MSDLAIKKIIEEVPNNFHSHGSLYADVLWRIADEHAASSAVVTAETGCGLSTLVLSHLSSHHTAFTVSVGDSLQNTSNHPMLNQKTTKFVVGPAQITLPAWQFSQPLDLVLLDGAHAYPFVELDYYYLYRHVRCGGTLIIDDIHIPTIGRLYEFLLDEEMWEHRGDVRTTAFFRRTSFPLLDPYGDGWTSQKYNRRHFPHPAALEPIYGPNWRDREFGSNEPEVSLQRKLDQANAEIERLKTEIAELSRRQ
jgi:Methyltransferase domain